MGVGTVGPLLPSRCSLQRHNPIPLIPTPAFINSKSPLHRIAHLKLFLTSETESQNSKPNKKWLPLSLEAHVPFQILSSHA